ncbi:MAG: peptidoglycan editing factor PgeF [Pseudomonadota bacterium]
MIEASGLAAISAISHGFFTREGGVSEGIYGSLNTGYGSDDDAARVEENRRRIAARLGVGDDQLLTIHQWHSSDAVVADGPWNVRKPPEGDAVVTNRPGLAVAVNTADCTPVLFSSGDGRVVGAAHAGWKGAIGGVLASTVARMKELGATEVHAAIGPTISQLNYEVGPEYRAKFVERDAGSERFFIASSTPGHFMFDLPGFVRARLYELELASIEDTGLCTYGDEQRFFSYRRTVHRGEQDYGRQLSAICIRE